MDEIQKLYMHDFFYIVYINRQEITYCHKALYMYKERIINKIILDACFVIKY